MGGEKIKNSRSGTNKEGSPPRGRGKGRLPGHLLNQIGITPAWAGKSGSLWSCCMLLWDHPRVGGEKHKEESSVMELQGSPPRGRGKVDTDCILNRTERITPAWAGKSCFS